MEFIRKIKDRCICLMKQHKIVLTSFFLPVLGPPEFQTQIIELIRLFPVILFLSSTFLSIQLIYFKGRIFQSV